MVSTMVEPWPDPPGTPEHDDDPWSPEAKHAFESLANDPAGFEAGLNAGAWPFDNASYQSGSPCFQRAFRAGFEADKLFHRSRSIRYVEILARPARDGAKGTRPLHPLGELWVRLTYKILARLDRQNTVPKQSRKKRAREEAGRLIDGYCQRHPLKVQRIMGANRKAPSKLISGSPGDISEKFRGYEEAFPVSV